MRPEGARQEAPSTGTGSFQRPPGQPGPWALLALSLGPAEPAGSEEAAWNPSSSKSESQNMATSMPLCGRQDVGVSGPKTTLGITSPG